jgi:hypothetical protein
LNEALQEVARERDEQSFFIALDPSLAATRLELVIDASSKNRMKLGRPVEKRIV